MTKVSVIIPVYNVEKYLEECLDSVINQTLKDIEIICINDGSTDNSLSILQEYAQKDERIKVIDLEKNSGQGIARNIGIESATGEYIGFIDPDDWIDLNMYQEMYNQAKELNSEIVICDLQKYQENTGKYLNYHIFENVISPLSVISVEMPVCINIDKAYLYNTLIASPGYCVNKIYSLKLVKHYNIKFSELRCYEDCIFNLRSHILANNISYINKSFYMYRIRQSSTIRSIDSRYNDAQAAYLELSTYLKNIGMKNIFSKNLKYFQNIHSILTYKNTADIKIKKQILKDAKTRLTESEFKIFLSRCGVIQNNKIYKIEYKKNHKIITLFDKIKIKIKVFNKPVDIVYCWVDGNDKKWQEEKNKWQKELNIPITDAINMCRFLDNEELKYSLRSVAKNAKWVHHIYIITNGQVPKWLDTSHPKITIVDHKEIMPTDALPVFSAYPIETCIADIPSLSEHFLYANDDFYIFQPITKSYFFDKKGEPIIRYVNNNFSKERIKKDLYLQNILYSRDLINNKFGKKYHFETTHNIDSYKKSYFLECKKTFQNEFNETLYSKFSRRNLVQRTIVNMYMLCLKHCKLKRFPINKNKKPRENIYIKLQSYEQMEKIINKNYPKLKLFCINDNETTLQENRECLGLYLNHLFPKKAKWEL